MLNGLGWNPETNQDTSIRSTTADFIGTPEKKSFENNNELQSKCFTN
jgi:hypothetical protein